MNFKLFIPGLAILAGLWFWQASQLSKLREEEQRMNSAVSRLLSLPPPDPASKPRTPAEPVQPPPQETVLPGPEESARALVDEFAALLGDGSTAVENAKQRELDLLKEKLAAQKPEVLRQLLRMIEEGGFPARKEWKMLTTVLYALDDTDPETCLRFVSSHETGREIGESIGGWIRAWASRDPAGTQQWLEEMRASGGLQKYPAEIVTFKQEGTIEDAMHVQLLCGQAMADPAGFDFHQLEGLDSGALFRFGADVVMAPMTAEQRALYLKRVWTEVNDGKTAEKLLTLAMSRWSDRVDGAELKQLVETLSNSSGTLSPERRMLLTRMRTDIAAKSGGAPSTETMDWALEGATEPDQRKHAITGLVMGWSTESFEDTGVFLNTLPEGPDRDMAVIKLAQLWGAYDSQVQLQWAARISDPALRKKTVAEFEKEIADDARRFPKRPD